MRFFIHACNPRCMLTGSHILTRKSRSCRPSEYEILGNRAFINLWFMVYVLKEDFVSLIEYLKNN